VSSNSNVDTAAETRQARFGKLPEPIAHADMIQELRAVPKGGDDYNAERSWLFHSCVALDLGF
jgi:hypothetical protein